MMDCISEEAHGGTVMADTFSVVATFASFKGAIHHSDHHCPTHLRCPLKSTGGRVEGITWDLFKQVLLDQAEQVRQ
jgi:hypothetical protein